MRKGRESPASSRGQAEDSPLMLKKRGAQRPLFFGTEVTSRGIVTYESTDGAQLEFETH